MDFGSKGKQSKTRNNKKACSNKSNNTTLKIFLNSLIRIFL